MHRLRSEHQNLIVILSFKCNLFNHVLNFSLVNSSFDFLSFRNDDELKSVISQFVAKRKLCYRSNLISLISTRDAFCNILMYARAQMKIN